MQRFSRLVTTLASTTKTNDKRDLLLEYFRDAPDADKLWLVALFTGRRPRRLVNSTLMKQWCMEITVTPPWLFDESYHLVGDLSESIALLVRQVASKAADVAQTESLAELMESLRVLQPQSDDVKHAFIQQRWLELDTDSCIVFNKLIMGGFRIGVSEALVIQALAAYLEQDPQAVAHLVSGNWDPYTTPFEALTNGDHQQTDLSKPYPFYLAYSLEPPVSNLGEPRQWQVEWKWDGIRGQLIRRGGSMYLWSRGEELITDKFPEILSLADKLPDGIVMDGEVLAYRDGLPISFQYLQTRITRKTVSKKQLLEAPTAFMAYDLLEYEGEDIRTRPLSERRALLEGIVGTLQTDALILSPVLQYDSWEALPEHLGEARERGCEGFMIKRLAAPYQAGRRRGDWWKWKVDPLSVDAVMIYAQKGSGKRSGLYTDYTFAVRDGEKLVPFAKAYSGLTDKEIGQVDRWVKANSIEQFGPVKTVKAELVFEISTLR